MSFSETHAFNTPEENTTDPNRRKRRRRFLTYAGAAAAGGAAVTAVFLASSLVGENNRAQDQERFENDREIINELAVDAASSVLDVLDNSRTANDFSLTQENYDYTTTISNTRITLGADGERPSADDPELSQAVAGYDKAAESIVFTASNRDESGNRDSESTKVSVRLHVNEGNSIAGSDNGSLSLSTLRGALKDSDSLEVEYMYVDDGEKAISIGHETLGDPSAEAQSRLTQAAKVLPSSLEQARASLLNNTQ